ncbi:MAG: hypothetical protein ACRC35_12280, partial [Angustibacter sp.]
RAEDHQARQQRIAAVHAARAERERLRHQRAAAEAAAHAHEQAEHAAQQAEREARWAKRRAAAHAPTDMLPAVAPTAPLQTVSPSSNGGHTPASEDRELNRSLTPPSASSAHTTAAAPPTAAEGPLPATEAPPPGAAPPPVGAEQSPAASLPDAGWNDRTVNLPADEQDEAPTLSLDEEIFRLGWRDHT